MVSCNQLWWVLIHLSKTGFLGWNVAPFLDDGFLNLPWVSSGPWTNFLGNVDTLFSGLEEGNQFSDMFAGPLGLQVTIFLRNLEKEEKFWTETKVSLLLEKFTFNWWQIIFFEKVDQQSDNAFLYIVIIIYNFFQKGWWKEVCSQMPGVLIS